MAGSTSVVPAARFTDLVTSEVGDEVLVYDLASHALHRLNAASAAVWQRCDGRRTIADLASASGMTEETVRVALGKLADAGLLRHQLATDVRGTGTSRRALLRKAAIAGSIPVIVSVTAPLAAQAQSGCTAENCENTATVCMGAICGSSGCVRFALNPGLTCVDEFGNQGICLGLLCINTG